MEKEILRYDRKRNLNEYNTENGLGNKYFEALGSIRFRYTNNGLEYLIRNVDEEVPSYIHDAEEIKNYIDFNREMYYQKWIACMMDGKEFLDCVNDGCFIDYDGTLSAIYVDGYLSNLGLCHKGIHQGMFMVDGNVFDELCKEHHILIDWANK